MSVSLSAVCLLLADQLCLRWDSFLCTNILYPSCFSVLETLVDILFSRKKYETKHQTISQLHNVAIINVLTRALYLNHRKTV